MLKDLKSLKSKKVLFIVKGLNKPELSRELMIIVASISLNQTSNESVKDSDDVTGSIIAD